MDSPPTKGPHRPDTAQIEDALFNPDGQAWRGVSPKLVKAWRIVTALVFGGIALAAIIPTAIAAPVWIAPSIGVVLFAFAALTWTLAGRRARAIGYLERKDDLLIRKGVLIRRMMLVPYGRLQFLDVQAGPLERMLGLASLKLTTAAGAGNAALPGLAPEEAARLRDQLSARCDARLAGL
jgi:membrane protein YdbS with pleckstrin-like domain